MGLRCRLPIHPRRRQPPTSQRHDRGPASANPFSKTILLGPYNYHTDIYRFTRSFSDYGEGQAESERGRVLNAFNIQGRVNPDANSGTESLQTSYWTPRQVSVLGSRYVFETKTTQASTACATLLDSVVDFQAGETALAAAHRTQRRQP